MASGQSAEAREILSILSAEWNMQERPRGFPTFLEMREEDNKIPTYWAGRYTGDTFRLEPEYDLLSGEVHLSAEGGFTAQFQNTAPRLGMRDKVPGGPWMEEPGEEGLRIVFHEFTDWQYPPAGTEPDPDDIRVEARFRGTFKVYEEAASLEGPVTLRFNNEIGTFTLRAESTLNGREAGLEPPHGGPIELVFHLQSANPKPLALPDPEPGFGEEDDFDLPGF